MKNWISNPSVLFKDITNIIPNSSDIKKNSIILARLAIFILIIINMTDINKKFNSIPMVLLLVSILIIPIENLKNKSKNCTMPTRNNECMNFVFGDSVYKKPACKITSAKCNQRFFTNPVTTVINDQKKFALSLYSKMGQCKAFGKNCGKNLSNYTGNY
jgi:hypothetical protein